MQKLILFLSLFISFQGYGQFNLPLNVQKAIQNNTRTTTGQPGDAYWSNHATYQIEVELEPDKDKISGSEQISYQNNSPDTLKKIVISVLSDAYKKQASRDYNYNLDLMNDGVTISKIEVNGKEVNSDNIKANGTNRIISLDSPLLPHSKIDLKMDWHFTFPDVQIRCGNYKDSTFFVAYFYPRIAVYDDIDGWDMQSYTLMPEFYSDFNDYDVQIKVPNNFVVWATGELQNMEKVFSKKIAKRFEKAHQTDKIVHIITKEDVEKGGLTQQKDFLTYHFKAQNVPDFAFGTSDKFLWDASSVLVDKKTNRHSFVSAAYRQDSEDYYKIAELEAKVLKNYSTRLPGVPYPYPVMTIFNGNSGMEFPMMCNDASAKEWVSSAGLTYHESAHTYFPFYMGINERKYAWMDEGWASFFPMFYIDEEDETGQFDYILSRAKRYYAFAGSDREIPLMTVTYDIKTRAPYRYTSYNKSYFSYYYLYRMLGEVQFKKCLVGYMNRWNGKHPIPFDFFNSFSDISGKKLDWYWENWYFDRNYADQSVVKGDDVIIVRNLGGLFVPIKLEITFIDGSVEIIEKEVDVWAKNDCQDYLQFTTTSKKKIQKIILGDPYILDVNRDNNIWEAK